MIPRNGIRRRAPRLITRESRVHLRQAIKLAAAEAGGGGDVGLISYLEGLAVTRPDLFVSLLKAALPMQAEISHAPITLIHENMSAKEACDAYLATLHAVPDEETDELGQSRAAE